MLVFGQSPPQNRVHYPTRRSHTGLFLSFFTSSARDFIINLFVLMRSLAFP